MNYTNKDNNRISTLWYFLLCLGFLFFISAFVLISFYNYPGGEDFPETNMAIDLGFWGHIHNLYTTWDGRYFSAALFAIHPLSFHSFLAYKIVPLVLMTLLFSSIWWVSSVTFLKTFSKKESFCLSIFFFSLILYQLPYPIGFFYYYIMSTIYGASVILSFLSAGSLFTMFHIKNKHKKLFFLILTCLFIFFTIGSLEVSLVLLPLFVLSILLYRWYFKKGQLKEASIVFLALSVAIFIHLSAPGIANDINQNNFGATLSIDYTLNTTLSCIKRSGHYIFNSLIIGNYLLIVLTILYIPIGFNLCKSNPHFRKGWNLPTFITIFSIFAIVLIMALPYYWALGKDASPYPARVFNVVYIYFLLAWFVSIHLIIAWFYRNFKLQLNIENNKIFIIAILMYWILIPFSSNWKTILNDITSKTIFKYNGEFKERITALKKAGKNDTVVVYLPTHQPLSIYNNIDLEVETDTWKAAYEEYFGVGSIVVKQRNVK